MHVSLINESNMDEQLAQLGPVILKQIYSVQAHKEIEVSV